MDAVERECAELLRKMVMPKSLEGRRRTSASDYFEPSGSAGQKRKAEEAEEERPRRWSSSRFEEGLDARLSKGDARSGSSASYGREPSPLGDHWVRGTRETEDLYSIFIGRLPRSVSAEDLRAFYAIYGSITNYQVRDSGDHQIGFVRFATEESARNALRGGNGLTLKGAPVQARYVLENPPHLTVSTDLEDDPFSIFISGIDMSFVEDDVYNAFRVRGHKIAEMKMPPAQKGRSHRIAFAVFATADEGRAAQADMNERILGPVKIQVSLRKKREGEEHALGKAVRPYRRPSTFSSWRPEQRDNGYGLRAGR